MQCWPTRTNNAPADRDANAALHLSSDPVAWVTTAERDWPEMRLGPEGTAMRFASAAELESIMIMVLIRMKICQKSERVDDQSTLYSKDVQQQNIRVSNTMYLIGMNLRV